MKSVRELRNIGAVTGDLLEKAGIKTEEDLVKTGSFGALVRIRAISTEGCLSMLYGLEGAIKGKRWCALSEKEKDGLKQKFAGLSKK